MYPGADFVYESCCPLQAGTGTMGGYFVMKRANGTTFNAIVPTFEFKIPRIIGDTTEEDGDGPMEDLTTMDESNDDYEDE